MINGIVKILTFWFMSDVVITTVHGSDKCKTYFCTNQMSLRAIWCGRKVILNQDGAVTGITPHPAVNTWKLANKI